MAMVKTISVKLGKMRKADDCVVYPRKDGENVIFQGDRVIGMFDPDTRKGVINFTKNPHFQHLNRVLGAQTWEYTPEFVDECIGATPKSGDVIGASDICGVVVIA